MSNETMTECTHCGSTELSWQVFKRNGSGVVDGRLRAHDIQCEFALGCDDCSETLRVVSADAVAGILDSQLRPVARLRGEAQAGQAVAERHKLYGTRWITQLRDMEPGTQWFIAGRADPIATVRSVACVIWHCSEADIPHGTKYYTSPQPAAPVGVDAEPSPVRALVAAANAVLAENPSDDGMWTLEQAVRPFNATKPAECADGCPPQQVCDYCQTASIAQQPDRSPPSRKTLLLTKEPNATH